MELILLDKSFGIIARIDDFYSLQWIERYYDFGKFELHTNIKFFKEFQNATYIMRNDNNRIMICESIVYSESQKEIIISGSSFEKTLNDYIIYKKIDLSGSLISILNILKKESFLPFEIECSFEQNIKFILKPNELGILLFEILKEYELSYRLIYNFESRKYILKIFKGLDRTSNQSINNQVIFSQELDTLTDVEFEIDSSNFKNYAVVIGDGDEYNPFIAVVDNSQGQEIKKMIVNGTKSRRKDNKDLSEQEYKKLLISEGNIALGKNKIKEIFDGEIINKNYYIDYNIGDLCDYIANDLNLKTTKRLIEVTEIFELGSVEIRHRFGDDYVLLKDLLKRGKL